MEEKETSKTVGPIQMFRFAGWLDILYMTIGFLAAIGNGICQPVMLTVFGDMTNSVLCYNSSLLYSTKCSQYKALPEQMTMYALYYVGIGGFVIICGFIQIFCWVLTSSRQTRKLRTLFFHSILSKDISWFDMTRSGELNTRLTEDINKIQDGIGDKLGFFIQQVATFIAGIIIGLLKGWQLVLVIMSTSPLVIIVTIVSSKVLEKQTIRELSSFAKAGAVAEEVLSSIRTVVAFGGQSKEVKRYTNNLEEAKSIGIRKAILSQLAVGIMYLIIFASFACGLWYGTTLVLGDCGFTIGDILVVFCNIVISTYCVSQANFAIEAFSVARGSAYNIFNIIDQPSKINSFSTEGHKPKNIKGCVEFKNVQFSYPSRPDVEVLKGFSLEVKPGQTVALVGQSGCGKTTVLQLLQRFYDPQGGEISIDEHDIRSLNISYYRALLGVVSQEPVLFGTTIKENISYGQDSITDDDIESAAKEANAYDFIMELPDKFETLVGERGAQLSGGQKQRIAIARSLVRKPKILLLDEPTSALDAESELIIQTTLDKVSASRTTIMIAHRLSTVKNADVIIMLENGIVLEQGTHFELMEKKENYFSLATAQTEEEGETRQVRPNPTEMASTAPSDAHSTPKCHEKEQIKAEEQQKNPTKINIFRLLQLNNSEWPCMLFGILAAVINGAASPAFCIVFAKFISIFGSNDKNKILHTVNIYCIIITIIGAASFITNFLQGFMFGKWGEVFTLRLRQTAFKAMLRQDISWFDQLKNNTGALTTRLASDASRVQVATGPRLGAMTSSIATLVASIAIIFVFGWEMGCLILAVLPIFSIIGYLQTRALKQFDDKQNLQLEHSGKIATEAVDNIRTVVSLNRTSTFENLYYTSLQKQHGISKCKALVFGITFALTNAFVYFLFAAMYEFGAFLIEAGHMNAEEFFLMFSILACGAIAVGQLLTFAPDYAKAKSAASYLIALLNSEPVIDSCSELGEKLETFTGDVDFHNISFSYPSRPDVPLLNEMTLKIPSGQTVTFVGHSGCGKSTCLQLIQRFYDPLKGAVLFDSVDIRRLNVQWLRYQIGVVSQEPVLFNRSIAENIAYGDNFREPTMEEIQQATKAANIHSFIEQLPEKYNTLVGGKGAQLSGGQKQRIAIARALIRNPKILLLDEATSALDNKSERVVQETLDQARNGKTCIVVAHKISAVQNSDIILEIGE